MPTWDERMRPTPKHEPQLQLVERHWVVAGPTGTEVACALYKLESGYHELRMHRAGAPDDVAQTAIVGSLQAGRALSREWMQDLTDKAGYRVVQIEMLHEP